jgi:hypothetical protein
LCRIESCCFDASDRFLWSDTDSLLNNDSAIAMHCMSNIVTDVCNYSKCFTYLLRNSLLCITHVTFSDVHGSIVVLHVALFRKHILEEGCDRCVKKA